MTDKQKVDIRREGCRKDGWRNDKILKEERKEEKGFDELEEIINIFL